MKHLSDLYNVVCININDFTFCKVVAKLKKQLWSIWLVEDS